MKKQKENYICPVCKKTFKTIRGLSIHKTVKNHYKIETKKLTKQVEYLELLGKNDWEKWGREMTKKEKSHPTMEILKMSVLFNILKEIKKLNNIFNHKKI